MAKFPLFVYIYMYMQSLKNPIVRANADLADPLLLGVSDDVPGMIINGEVSSAAKIFLETNLVKTDSLGFVDL